MEETNRLRGKITRVDPRGYGFISSKEKPYTRIFFHWEGLKITTKHFTELTRGMEVEFELVKRDRGWCAIKIEIIE